MSKKYLNQCIRNIPNNSIDNFIKSIDYNQLSTDEVATLLYNISDYHKVLDKTSVIHLIDSLKSRIDSYEDIIRNDLYMIYNAYNDEEYKNVIDHYIENNDINVFVIDMIVNSNLLLNNNIDLDKNIMDKIVYELTNYIDLWEEVLDSLIKNILKNKNLFSNNFLNILMNQYKDQIENILDKTIIYSLDTIYNIYQIDEYLHNSDISIEELSSIVGDSFENDIITYFDQIDIEYFTSRVDVDKFVDELKSFIYKYEDDLYNVNTLNNLYITLKYTKNDLDDNIDYLIQNDDKDTHTLITRIELIKDSNLSNSEKLKRIGLLFIKLLSNENINNIKNSELLSVEFSNIVNSDTYIIYGAIINSKSIIENINNIDFISDKSKYLILRDIKNINSDLYRKLIEEALDYMNNLKDIIKCVEREL